jgi:hypothetical protein
VVNLLLAVLLLVLVLLLPPHHRRAQLLLQLLALRSHQSSCGGLFWQLLLAPGCRCQLAAQTLSRAEGCEQAVAAVAEP